MDTVKQSVGPSSPWVGDNSLRDGFKFRTMVQLDSEEVRDYVFRWRSQAHKEESCNFERKVMQLLMIAVLRKVFNRLRCLEEVTSDKGILNRSKESAKFCENCGVQLVC